jgi:hypothetical protein
MQLAILLYLMHRRGESVPTHRTELYRDYMALFLDREAEKSPLVSANRDMLEDVTRFLGWILQAAAEANAANGRLSLNALKRHIRRYLADQEKPTEIVDQLFTAMSERVWVITSRFQNTFEFDVQLLREFFAAEHLARTAPPARPGKRGDKFDRLEELITRPYWLNTARFMAGCFTDGELAAVAESLEAVKEADPTRMWNRRVSHILLSDGSFDARPRSIRAVITKSNDTLGQRVLLHDIESRQAQRLDDNRGGTELAQALRDALLQQPGDRLAGERVRLLLLHQQRVEVSSWWLDHFPYGQDEATVGLWLSLAVPLQAAAGLHHSRLAQLADSHTDAPAMLLAAGAQPRAGSLLEKSMLQAVLSGACSETGAEGGSLPADILRAFTPLRFLAKTGPGSQAYAFIGLTHPTVGEWTQRYPSRLRQRPEFKPVLAATRESKGQGSTTSVWGNVARELTRLFGPCWLANEIAIIGASAVQLRTGGDISPSAAVFDPPADAGSMISDLRVHSNDQNWWIKEGRATKTELGAATWALALVSCAEVNAIHAAQDVLAQHLELMSSAPRRVLMSAAARLGMYGVARSLDPLIVSEGAGSSIWNALLLAPFIPPADVPYLLDHLGVETAVEMARHDTYSWPVIWSACESVNTSPDKSIAVLEAAHWETDWPPDRMQEALTPEAALQLLNDPASYPWNLLDLADSSIEQRRTAPHLLEVGQEQGWFDFDD